MSDLIDRQAAINAVNGWLRLYAINRTMSNTTSIQDVLQQLPSAQPLVLTCDGCRHVGTYDTEFPCSGCIRREKDYYEQER